MANKKRVIFFKSDDGALHETEEACDRANNLLAAKPRILEMLASENPDAVPFTPEFVADWMIKSAPDLAQLLSNLVNVLGVIESLWVNPPLIGVENFINFVLNLKKPHEFTDVASYCVPVRCKLQSILS